MMVLRSTTARLGTVRGQAETPNGYPPCDCILRPCHTSHNTEPDQPEQSVASLCRLDISGLNMLSGKHWLTYMAPVY